MPASRSTCALTSARPASRPSARPCAKASLCASACRSARPPTVGSLLVSGAPSMEGAVHSDTPDTLVRTSDKLAVAFAAQADGAFFGQALRNHDDFFLRRFHLGQFDRSAGLHVVLQYFR